MQKNKSYYSQEMNKVMQKLPMGVVRWGLTVIFFIFLGIFLTTFFIKIPESISAPLSFITNNTPVNVIAIGEGCVDSLFFKTNDYVKGGSAFGYLKNESEYRFIIQLENNLIENQENSIEEIASTTFWGDNEKNQLGPELQNAYLLFCDICKNLQRCLHENINTQFVNVLKKWSIQSRDVLLALIGEWKSRYVLIVPIDGQIIINKESEIEKGDIIASVIPNQNDNNILGRMVFPIEKMQDIKVGMDVELEGGFKIKGRVEKLQVMNDNKCEVKVLFNKEDFISNKLDYTKKQVGRIVISRYRLINKIINI